MFVRAPVGKRPRRSRPVAHVAERHRTGSQRANRANVAREAHRDRARARGAAGAARRRVVCHSDTAATGLHSGAGCLRASRAGVTAVGDPGLGGCCSTHRSDITMRSSALRFFSYFARSVSRSRAIATITQQSPGAGTCRRLKRRVALADSKLALWRKRSSELATADAFVRLNASVRTR